jgi:hypothetical protein
MNLKQEIEIINNKFINKNQKIKRLNLYKYWGNMDS